MSKDNICDSFQNSVSECLVRHKSILDVVTKLQESSSRINRAIAKTVTNCGCLEIEAKKQKVPDNINFSEICNYMENHLKGELCESCKEILDREIGANLFYIVALCNLMNINFQDILRNETGKLNTLGIYNMS